MTRTRAPHIDPDLLSLLDPDETILATKQYDEALVIVTSNSRKLAVDPDGWVSQSSGPDLCVPASGFEALDIKATATGYGTHPDLPVRPEEESPTESADARAD